PTADGSFALELQTQALPEGEHYFYAAVNDGYNPAAKAFAPGSIVVNHADADGLPRVEGLTITERDDRSLWLAFDRPSSLRVHGFALYVQKKDTVQRFDLGYLNTTDVSWLKEEE